MELASLLNAIGSNIGLIVVIFLAVAILRRLGHLQNLPVVDRNKPEPLPADIERYTKAELLDYLRER